eukprot:1151720-Pelagomonas_calceolata.AAC.1
MELCRPMLRHSTSERFFLCAGFWHFCTKSYSRTRAHAPAPLTCIRGHRHRLLLVLRRGLSPSMSGRVLKHTRALSGDTAWRCLTVIPRLRYMHVRALSQKPICPNTHDHSLPNHLHCSREYKPLIPVQGCQIGSSVA